MCWTHRYLWRDSLSVKKNTSHIALNSAGTRVTPTLLTAIAPIVWGTSYIVTTELLPPGHPLFAALMRSLPAGVIALVIARKLPKGAWWWKSAILGTLNIGLFFPLLFIAAGRLPGGVAATLGATQPILVTVLAVLVLAERLSWWRLGWGLVGVGGVALVVLGPGAVFDPVGIAAGVGGSAAMGVGVILAKRWGRPPGLSAMGFAGWQLAAGGLALLIPTLAFEGIPARIDAAGVAGYLWLGLIGGLLAYTLWFRGIGRLPVTATALLGLLSPLVAAILGVTIGGETLDNLQLAGFALALAALAAGQFSPRFRQQASLPSSAHRFQQSH